MIDLVRGLIDQIYKKERMYISNYDKDNIPVKTVQLVTPFMDLPEMAKEKIEATS